VNTDQELKETEKTQNESTEDRSDGGAPEPEFKVTVRKLEMPVRPRGVLAE
jgi:hypothetical protein